MLRSLKYSYVDADTQLSSPGYGSGASLGPNHLSGTGESGFWGRCNVGLGECTRGRDEAVRGARGVRLMLLTLSGVMLCAAMSASSAFAYEFSIADVKVKPFASDRVRFEVVDWFDPGPATENDYWFFANVLRFGAKLEHPSWEITVEGQDVSLVHLPDDGVGPGSVYFANTRNRDQHETHIRQGFLELPNLGVEGFSLKGGRFIFSEGLEGMDRASDPNLKWLKKSRVSQRLIGRFDYTHVGRSFDGGKLNYDRGPLTLTFMGGIPTAGGFNVSANKNIGDIHTTYAAATITEPTWLPRSDMRVFYNYYTDGRDVVATDNRPLAIRQGDDQDINVHTIGGNFTKVCSLGPGNVDAMLWVAGQFGDWERQDHRAYAVAVEAGYRLNDLPWKPWFRTGYFRGSGDDDPTDGDHDTFFQVLPTARLYAMTPFYNLMNNQDVFVQMVLKPLPNLLVRSDYHYLRVSENDDLVYSGGGATQSRPVFGYGGFSARGDDSIAHFIDLTVAYTMNEHLKFSAYYGHAFGQSVISNEFPVDDDLNYAYFETTISF